MKCIYFPFSRCISENHLKKALLFFEGIVFSDSQPQFMRSELLGHSGGNPEKLEKVYAELEEECAIEIINPTEELIKYDHLLTSNIKSDIGDDSFFETAINHSSDDWSILYERLPPSLIKEFYPGAGTYSEAISLHNIVWACGDYSKIPEKFRRFAEFRYPETTPEKALEHLKKRYKYVIGRNPHVLLNSYSLPFSHASSLRINEMLLLSELYGYTPFTDSSVHSTLLSKKIQRAFNINEADSPNVAGNSYQELSFSIFDKIIFDDALKNLSFKDIIKYRDKNHSKLERYNIKVNELLAKIDRLSNNRSYELNKIIDKELMPELVASNDEFEKDIEKSLGKLFIQSVGVAIPTISTSFYAGLGAIESMCVLAAAEGTFLSTKGAKDIVNSISALNNRKRNPYSYILNLG